MTTLLHADLVADSLVDTALFNSVPCIRVPLGPLPSTFDERVDASG